MVPQYREWFFFTEYCQPKGWKQYTAGLDDSAILTPATKAEGAKLHVCYCSPPSLIPSLLSLLITRTRISACKPDETVVPPSRVFLVARIFLPPCKQPLQHSTVDVRPQKKVLRKLPKMITAKSNNKTWYDNQNEEQYSY